MSIPCYIGSSREAPYGESNRISHAGTEVPRPFDIRGVWKQPVGRSSGGFYHLGNYETMEWQYLVGIDTLYNTFAALYNPVNPFVWVYFPDLYDNDGSWWEAAMQEPRLGERSTANVIKSLSIFFTHMTKV